MNYLLRVPRSLIALAMLIALALALAQTGEAQSPEDGGGEYNFDNRFPPLTLEQRQAIQNDIDNNIYLLRAQGRLAEPKQSVVVSLGWPLAMIPGPGDFGYHGISNFVDHDPTYPNHLLDWNCGTRTYDTSGGYNHAGTDFFTWPFPWSRMDANRIQIIAAAPGTIVSKSDGNYDRSCAMGSGAWNAVYVQHADGTVAWYGHMKKNSLTSKLVGQTVAAGEYLGIVGSSGSSTGPHLHLELHDSSGSIIDPYQGTCNAEASLWASQPPYYDSAVNRLMVSIVLPATPTCPNPETPNDAYIIPRGSVVYFVSYYRDELANQSSQYAIYKPDGSVFASWSRSFSSPSFHAASWWWRSYTLSASVPLGIWRFEDTFNGTLYRTNFVVADQVRSIYLPNVLR